jgi:hypothetical protein
MNSIVGKCLEEANALGSMIVPAIGRRLRRPADDNIMPVPFVEDVPVLCIPGIVERLHQF